MQSRFLWSLIRFRGIPTAQTLVAKPPRAADRRRRTAHEETSQDAQPTSQAQPSEPATQQQPPLSKPCSRAGSATAATQPAQPPAQPPRRRQQPLSQSLSGSPQPAVSQEIGGHCQPSQSPSLEGEPLSVNASVSLALTVASSPRRVGPKTALGAAAGGDARQS